MGVFLIALVVGRSAYERYRVERDMAGRLHEREQELSELKERAALLEVNVDHLKNERGIEEEIRGRFDVAKDGEQVVVIIDDEKAGTSSSIQSAPPSTKQGTTSVFEKFSSWFR